MLPTTATPSAPPSSRVVSLTAEPMFARSGGSEPMIDSVAGAPASPMPGAHEQRTRRRAGRSRVLVRDRRRDGQAGREQQHPGGRDALGAEARDELRRERRADDHRARVGQHAHAGGRRRVAEHELQVLRRQEQEPEEREEQHHDRGAGGGEARVAEQADVEQRLRDAALPDHERGQRDRGERAGGRAPARTSSPRDGASMIAHTSAIRPAPESAAPGPVDPPRDRVARLGDEPAPGDDRERGTAGR